MNITELLDGPDKPFAELIIAWHSEENELRRGARCPDCPRTRQSRMMARANALRDCARKLEQALRL